MMNKVIINYKYSRCQIILSLVVGGYTLLYSTYNAIVFAIAETYTIAFFVALLGIVLGLVLILKATLFSPKPIFEMDADNIFSKAGDKKIIYRASWENIKNVSIGLSYLKIIEVGNKEYEVDLSNLKYTDLKNIKSKIIELCEAKMISYQND